MNTRINVVFFLISASITSGAIYYLDEDFESSFPPTGWGIQSWGDFPQSANWVQDSGGPWGQYAYGYSNVGGTYLAAADLYTCAISVPVGSTFYYCFNYTRIDGIYGQPHSYFCIGTPPNPFFAPSSICNIELSQTSQWHTCDGSAVNTLGTNLAAAWRVYALCQGSYLPATISLSVDNARISDEPFTTVELSSLGSIKASFK